MQFAKLIGKNRLNWKDLVRVWDYDSSLEDFSVHFLHIVIVEKVFTIRQIITHFLFKDLTQKQIPSYHFMVQIAPQLCPNYLIWILLINILQKYFQIGAEVGKNSVFKEWGAFLIR